MGEAPNPPTSPRTGATEFTRSRVVFSVALYEGFDLQWAGFPTVPLRFTVGYYPSLAKGELGNVGKGRSATVRLGVALEGPAHDFHRIRVHLKKTGQS